jgi:hypothetical protein
MIPCIVITRDRASYTKRCIESLTMRGADLEIHIMDHGSTYRPMLDLLEDLDEHFYVHEAGNRSPRDLWEWPPLRELVGDEPYLVTDPDLVLDPDCPRDWIEVLHRELQCGTVAKVGLGLRIDDLPDTQLARDVIKWESSFWLAQERTGAYRAPVDTTLAMYVPLSERPEFTISPARRLPAPYLARHLPWYGDLDPEETLHYRTHCRPGASHWVNGGWRLAP